MRRREVPAAAGPVGRLSRDTAGRNRSSAARSSPGPRSPSVRLEGWGGVGTEREKKVCNYKVAEG